MIKADEGDKLVFSDREMTWETMPAVSYVGGNTVVEEVTLVGIHTITPDDFVAASWWV